MSENKFIPFALPDIGEEEIAAVVTTLRSGWVTTGPVTLEFEKQFASFIGGEVEAIAVNSATAGLHLALEACGIKDGDEVILPTLTFTATAEVVRYLGADPVFVDCNLDTLCLDINQIESKITAKTRAIIPVHMGGFPCDMERILAIAKKYNLRVIEDAAHTCPSKINNIMIGQHASDAIIYSFYANKTITTGEGGMIVSKNPDIIKRCKVMRLHGMSRDAFNRFTAKTPSWYYEIVAPGYKYNLTDIASSMGICQLAKANRFQAIRQKMAERYLAELADLPLILPPQVKNPTTDLHSWHLFCCQLNTNKISRNDFIQALSDKGIGTSVHYIPLHMQPYWRDRYNLKDVDYPKASGYYKNAFTIPLYTKLSDDDQTYIINTIREILS
jgi:dTDP-4-amino-4,6-dideoxygalactose transaminase